MKYKITVERPAWIEETWVVETDDIIKPSSVFTKCYLPEKWMDDNAEQLGTEVLRHMDDEELKIHGFCIYINDVKEEV